MIGQKLFTKEALPCEISQLACVIIAVARNAGPSRWGLPHGPWFRVRQKDKNTKVLTGKCSFIYVEFRLTEAASQNSTGRICAIVNARIKQWQLSAHSRLAGIDAMQQYNLRSKAVMTCLCLACTGQRWLWRREQNLGSSWTSNLDFQLKVMR